MRIETFSSTAGEPLLRRLRRMGWILTGDQQVADSVVQTAFDRARQSLARSDDVITEADVFRLGFDAFDDAVHQKGVVVLLNREKPSDGSLGDDVRRLTYVERVAIALLIVEEMSPKQAAILSGRPAGILENCLKSALGKLDDTERGRERSHER